MVLTKANLVVNPQRGGLHFSGGKQTRPFVIITTTGTDPCVYCVPLYVPTFPLNSNKTVHLFKWKTVLILALRCSRASYCLSEMHPAEGAEAWLHGWTHTLQGQIWTAPVKEVNPTSLAGARKSERDGPDSQSARGRRLSPREQSTNPANCVVTSSPSPLILFQSCTFWIILLCNSSQVLFHNLIWYFNLGELGYGFRTPCRTG